MRRLRGIDWVFVCFPSRLRDALMFVAVAVSVAGGVVAIGLGLDRGDLWPAERSADPMNDICSSQ